MQREGKLKEAKITSKGYALLYPQITQITSQSVPLSENI